MNAVTDKPCVSQAKRLWPADVHVYGPKLHCALCRRDGIGMHGMSRMQGMHLMCRYLEQVCDRRWGGCGPRHSLLVALDASAAIRTRYGADTAAAAAAS